MYELPNAKINIGLNVVERRKDGYHNLQTIFYPIPLTDSLEIKPLENKEEPYDFQSSGFKIPGNSDENLVVRVFTSMQKEFGLPNTSIHLAKRIPMGAGLGGGSADAAFMMKMLNDCYGLGLSENEMEARMAAFGADCPFFIKNKPVYAEGIGNEFYPINISLKGYYIALVKPDIHVSTAQAYSNVRPVMPQKSLAQIITETPISQWKGVIKNDFEDSVFPLFPGIKAIKDTLYDMGAIYASMSGSGSAVYGIFSRPVDNVATIFPNCFTMSNQLG